MSEDSLDSESAKNKTGARWWYILPQPAVYLSADIAIEPFIPAFFLLYFDGNQATAVWAVAAYLGINDFFGFIVSGWIGRISDAIGRKWLAGFGSVSNLIPYVILGAAGVPGVPAFMAFYMLAGLAAVQKPMAAAYIQDLTTPEKRPLRNMFSVGAMLAWVGLLGGIIVGAELDWDVLRWSPIIFIGIGILYMLWLPESLPKEHRIPWKEARPYFNAITDRKKIGLAPSGFVLTLIASLSSFQIQGMLASFPIFLAAEFGFTPANILQLYLIVSFAMVIWLVIVPPIVMKFFSVRTFTIIILAITSLSNFLMIFANEVWMMNVLFSLWGSNFVIVPNIFGMLSVEVSPSAQGTVVGAASACVDLGGVLGNFVIAGIFSATVGIFTPTFIIIIFAANATGLLLVIFKFKELVPWEESREIELV